MKILNLLIMIAVFIGINACGEKPKEVKDAETALEMAKNMAQNGEKIKSAQEKADEIWKERKAKGDTIPLHYKELQKYLPDEIPGYSVKNTGGETMNLMGFNYSEANRKFFKEGQGVIKVTIIDMNGSGKVVGVMAPWWMTNMSIENDNDMSKTFPCKINNCYGYETFHKKTGNAEISLFCDYRYLITIDADKQESFDAARELLHYVKIKELINH